MIAPHIPRSSEGWQPLGRYLRRSYPIVVEIMREIHRQAIIAKTRRTVQVATRKYQARRRRR